MNFFDLNSYFLEPNVDDYYLDKERWEATQIGRSIDTHVNGHFPSNENYELAFFNVSEFEGSKNSSCTDLCKIRPYLYSLHFENLPKIVDLGLLKLDSSRKKSFKLIQDVCEILIQSKIIPIVIGGGHDISYAIYKSYVSLSRFVTLTVVDNKFDIGLQDDNLASFSHLGKVISFKPSHLFHYVNLCYQSYFVSPMAIDMLQKMNFDVYRLGEIKSNLNEIEPIMRNTDFLSIDLSAIQNSFVSANVYSGPNGLSGEEICKLMRYAGISDKITSLGVFEYNQNLDKNGQSAQLISQMIWYFLEGYSLRKNELNPNVNNCIKYTVSFDDGRNEIIFYKSKKSSRWWMGVPVKSEKNKNIENYFIACSYKDYELAMKGDIPPKWIKTYKKLS